MKPTTLKLIISGEREEVESAHRTLVDFGLPIDSGPTLNIKIEGSPLFDAYKGQLRRVESIYSQKFDVSVIAKSSSGESAVLGSTSCGIKFAPMRTAFEWKLERCPLQLTFEIVYSIARRVFEVECNVKWSPEVWFGAPLEDLPWLLRLARFWEILSLSDGKCEIALSRHGKDGGNFQLPGHLFSGDLDLRPQIAFFRKLAYVARVTRLPLIFERSWNSGNIDDFRMLYSIFTTGFCELQQQPLQMTIDHSGSVLPDLKEGAHPIILAGGIRTYELLNFEFPMPGSKMEFHDATALRVAPVAGSDGESVISATHCTPILRWDSCPLQITDEE